MIRTTSSDLGTTSTDTVPAGVTDISQVACPVVQRLLRPRHHRPRSGAAGRRGGPDLATSTTPGRWWHRPATTFASAVLPGLPDYVDLRGERLGRRRAHPTAPGHPPPRRRPGHPGHQRRLDAHVHGRHHATSVNSVGRSPAPRRPCARPSPSVTAERLGPDRAHRRRRRHPFQHVDHRAELPHRVQLRSRISPARRPPAWPSDRPAGPTARVDGATSTQSPHDWSVATTIPNGVAAVRRWPAVSRPAVMPPTASWRPTRPAPRLPVSSSKVHWPVPAAGPGTRHPPSGTSPVFFTGVACESNPSRQPGGLCRHGGDGERSVVASTGSGPAGNWSIQTPSSLPGALVTGIPLETEPASSTTWSAQVAAASPQRHQPAQRALPPTQRLFDRHR